MSYISIIMVLCITLSPHSNEPLLSLTHRIGHFDFKRILKIGGVVASEDEPRAQQLQVITNPLAKVVHSKSPVCNEPLCN